MTARTGSGFPLVQGLAVLATATVVLAAGACASQRVTVRDTFPLDPREQLPGRFSGRVERGFEALLAGDASAAAKEFSAVRGKSARAAQIGWIEARVASGDVAGAVGSCARMLEATDPTLPLLVACGEAQAADGRPGDAYRLYRQALGRGGSSRPGLVTRTEELRYLAAGDLARQARSLLRDSRIDAAREKAREAVELAPESGVARAAEAAAEYAAGDPKRALALYREAVRLAPDDDSIAEEAGNVALENGDYALAVSVFERLEKKAPTFAERAQEARLAFRVANWPEPERQAARAPKLSRAGAAVLVWWMVPEVREAVVASAVVASDAVSRRDSRAVTRAVALGLLETDQETHRVSPDAPLTVGAAARLLARLLMLLEPQLEKVPCAADAPRPPRTRAETAQIARDCGLIEGMDSLTVRGADFVASLDRLHSLTTPQPEDQPR